jgi:perosamine synthetase
MSGTDRIAVAQPTFNGNEKKYLLDCIDTGWISSVGKYVGAFESGFARATGTRHAFSCANGTVGLHLALLALGVGPGDEVIVPSFTYIASANAVTYCGARPVLADCDAETWTVTVDDIAPRITAKTRGVMPVSLYGHPVDLDPILDFCRSRNLFVLEDAAEAQGATYKGKPVGSLADASLFSFFGNKIITTGEGGMLVTNREDLADRIRVLRNQGNDPQRRYWHNVVGYNYRMTNMQAAVGLGQLERIDWHLGERRRVAAAYARHLEPLSAWIDLPRVKPWATHCFWMYVVALKPEANRSRDEVAARMAQAGVETRPAFYPLHHLPPYQQKELRLPVTESIAARGLCLPTHAGLSEADIERVARELKRALEA